MKEIFETGSKILELAQHYPLSLYGSLKNRTTFESIETYCLFIGYPRSGHSIVGSLLDAHPNIVIAHELGALKYIHAGFNRRQIEYLILKKSQAFTRAGRKWSGYSAVVPHQWQGRFEKIVVIGDKQGSGATLRLQANPWLLQRLRNTFNTTIKFIHVIRNPYDNISTIFKRAKGKANPVKLEDSINFYFSHCETIANLKREIDEDCIVELAHESFVANPKICLQKLCCFLGVGTPIDYLDDCASIVFKVPHKSRDDIQWSRTLIDLVAQKIESFPFLQGYSYET